MMAWALEMNGSCHQLFTGSIFTRYKDARIGGACGFNQFLEFSYRETFTHNGESLVNALLEGNVFGLESLFVNRMADQKSDLFQ